MPYANREDRLAYAENYRFARPDVIALGKTRYNHSAKGPAARFRYNHSPKGRAADCRYLQTEKGRLGNCAKRAARRAKEQSTPAIRAIYARAQELRRWFDVVVDHIIPLAKGGTHIPKNLQIIYRRENMEKGARLAYTPTVIFS